MNRLTAVFLQQLYACAPQKQDLLKRAKRELLLQLDRSLPELLSPSTLIASAKGQELRQQTVQWKQRTEQCSHMEDITFLLEQLYALQKQERQLHTETRREIQSSGFVDGTKLHLFYRSEQRNALQVLDEMIRIELFRIAVLGGAQRFKAVQPLAAVPDILADRLAYYKNCLMPVLLDLSDQVLYGCWAFRFQEESRTGPLGNLPGYLMAEPNPAKAAGLLPGEYTVLPTAKGAVFQGVGCLTNLTPDTVEWAQRVSVQDHIPVAELAARLYHDDPVRVLGDYFGSTPYIVDPYELFAAADVARGAQELAERGRTRRCFLCGKALKNQAPLCTACVEKVCLR